MAKEKVEYECDIVVIGAGLCGLTFANTAAMRGWNVAVVEKHFKPGGYATNFDRKGEYTFDCSQHKITGIGPDGNMRDALTRAGLWDKIKFHEYTDLTCVFVEDKRYEFPVEYNGLKAKTYEYFPEDREGIDQFFKDIETHGYQNYMFARMALGEYTLNTDLLSESRKLSKRTAKAYFESLFSNPHLTVIWSTIASNLGCLPEEADALYFLHFAYTFLSTGVGYVHGTAQSLSDDLAAEAVSRGVRFFYSEEVQNIHVAEGAVQSVETKRSVIRAPEVVATCAPQIVRRTITEGSLGEKFDEKLGKLKVGLSSFINYLALDCAPADLGFNRSEYFLTSLRGIHLTDEEKATDLRYKHWPILITNYHKLDPTLGNVIQVTSHDVAGQWFALDRLEYRKEKERVAGIILGRVYEKFPQVRGHVKFHDCSSPKTNFKYTRSPEGAAYGFKATPGRNVRFLQKPRVQGLQFVGTWVNGAGYEPAVCLGFTFAYLRPEKPQL